MDRHKGNVSSVSLSQLALSLSASLPTSFEVSKRISASLITDEDVVTILSNSRYDSLLGLLALHKYLSEVVELFH